MSEQWLPVVGHEGKYEVSDLGRVRGLDRLDSRGQFVRGRVLAAGVNSAGYLTVVLHADGERSSRQVHALVLAAFVSPRPPGMEGCHGNGDPMDNRLLNLRWDTRSANMQDSIGHGTHHFAGLRQCESGHAFTDENTYRYHGERHCRTCQREASRRYRSRQRIRAALLGESA